MAVPRLKLGRNLCISTGEQRPTRRGCRGGITYKAAVATDFPVSGCQEGRLEGVRRTQSKAYTTRTQLTFASMYNILGDVPISATRQRT